MYDFLLLPVVVARVVVRAAWTSSSVNIRRDLHWLPVGHCITYKLCLTTWKTLHTSQPFYLSEIISFLTIFRPDPCVLPIRISLPDHPVLL